MTIAEMVVQIGADIADLKRNVDALEVCNAPAVRIAAALERIADVLEGFEPATEEPCQHPAEQRQDLSVMGHERWRCACGYSVGCEGMPL